MKATLQSVVCAAAVLAMTGVVASSVRGETLTPIDLTGYNDDAVVETGALGNQSAAAFADGVYYEQGAFSARPTWGLTSGVQTSAADPNTTFELQSFTENNALLLDDPSGTLTLSTPGKYSELAVFCASAGGAATLDYTIHYVSGGTSTGSITADDWWWATGVAVNEYDKAVWNSDTSSWQLALTSNPDPGVQGLVAFGANIYQRNITSVDAARAITSIDFSREGGISVIFAVSGAEVPEPSMLALLATGLLGLLAYAWRRQE